MTDTPSRGTARYPYDIHACVPDAEHRPYPTHTHGLADLGLPEMFINHEAFGPMYNGAMLNRVYDILQANSKLVDEIRTNVHVAVFRTSPDDLEQLVLMARLVSPLFSAVIAAYGDTLDPNGEYVQLYVDGDTHVLAEHHYDAGPAIGSVH